MARKEKASAAKGSAAKGKEGDPLKLFTVVMALLVVVIAVLYFMINGTRNEYAEANKSLERMMSFQGPARSDDRPPSTIPDLAWEVESLSNAYQQASGGGGLERGIPSEMMDRLALNAHLVQKYSSAERPITGGGGRYETITQRYDYLSEGDALPRLAQLLNLVWNIEATGRYRVSEIMWQAAEPTDNPSPPFDRIKKPQIQVSLRVPTLQ